MRVTELLSKTLREAPRDSEGGNQELLVRAGFVRQLTSGVYIYLPLGYRVMHKIIEIVRKEMDRVGAQEVIMPIIQPKDPWDRQPANGRPSRAEMLGDVLFKLKDRKGRDMVLAPTHEEVVTSLVSEFVRSYRDLPQLIYQIQTKFRDEPRPRGGLLRTREFIMKDLYSFDADAEGLEISYAAMTEAYRRTFTRCGLQFITIEADSGAIGGKDSQEFIALTEAGEDDAMVCDKCEYAANREKAEFVRTELPGEPEAALEEVYTPGTTSIADLANFLHIPEAKTMKSVCYVAGEKLVLAIVRGDLEINEVKLTNTLYHAGINASDLHLATMEELEKAGIVAGYTSPVAKDERVFIVADLSLKMGNNFVAGANRVDHHIKNVNYLRDFHVDVWEDIASAYAGATCARCGGTLQAVRGTEVGHIFKVGALYSDLFGVTYVDADGTAHPIVMGTYGMGIGRIMAAIVEQSHDEKGIRWPITVAPYQVMLIGLDLDKEENRRAAEHIYNYALAAGIEILYDDRAETAGVKFKDADLIGIPIRVVASSRSLQSGGVEIKMRWRNETRIVSLEESIFGIKEEIWRWTAAINGRI
ncbi:MAG TPA: proline--tRNA ligase [Ktedonobacteraceae bacterium]|nr:proline--tRNA ligase [Ktedonobacteraceae bacterium]